MKNLRSKSIFLLIVLVMCALSIYPPTDKLRLGKDLRGGTTLVYSVDIAPGEDAGETISKVIDVLKDRVDPDGIFDITMIAQGQDRIEITMPLPSERVKQLKKAYEDALAVIDARSIDRADFERVMRSPVESRTARITQVAGDSGILREVLDDAAAALDRAVALRSQYEFAESQRAPDSVLDQLAEEIAEAEIRYSRARDAAISSMPSGDELRRILDLSDRPLILKDAATDEYRSLDSSRKRALDRFQELHAQRLGSDLTNALAAHDTYIRNRTSLDDPSDLIRLLRGAGVLSFRITVDPQGSGTTNTHPEEFRLREELREKGPLNVRSRDARWVKINRIEAWIDTIQQLEMLDLDPGSFFRNQQLVVEPYDGAYWVLAWDTSDRRLTQADDPDWSVAAAFNTADSSGRPAIGFRMNTRGSRMMGDLTGNNLGNKMAVLLDDEVYTAPNIQGRITRNGQITGNFSTPEREYIIRVLNAGSLQAKLSSQPLSENTIAPELGLDNLRAGLVAGLIALMIVSAFMVFYYFGYGLIAVLALLCNAVLILAAMSLAKAAFSLPGIAGVILTFGMAVDANVLIFERIREEFRAGKDFKAAVRLGYEKALSSIVDGNVTNLIVCVVLGQLGTQEIRGFAITLGIGVCTTLFSALFISRLLMTFITDVAQLKRMSMLALAFPVIDRVLEPKINWVGLRYVSIVISTIFVGIGVAMVVFQGEKMLDMEFRGGVQVTLRFGTDDQGKPIIMERAQVLERVRNIGKDRAALDPLRAFTLAEAIPVNPEAGGISSNTFLIKAFLLDDQAVAAPTSLGARGQDEVQSPIDTMVRAIISAFEQEIDTRSPVAFVGDRFDSIDGAPVYSVLSPTLGENIRRSEYRENVSTYIGGVAIVIDVDASRIERLPTLDGLADRIDTMRSKPDFSDALRHETRLIILRGSPDAVETFVLLARDSNLSFFDNEDVWRVALAEREWDLVRSALGDVTTLASVQTFSPVIAERFKQTAIVSVLMSFLLILIYIWVRFGSVRYSLAAVVALTHDVLVVIGLIALAEIAYDHPATASIAQSIGVAPFKIDLTLVAAILTIIGYSLNDTIIIMDRIRENRGKLPYASASVINLSINQTMSRTAITSGTTLLAVIILYIWGGDGVRAFSYALLTGIIVGTYSTVAVAAPLVWSKKTGGPSNPST